MKKLLLLCCLLPLAVMAQIGPITTSEKRLDMISAGLILDKQTHEISVHIYSTNEFEDEILKIKLGTSYDEAIESLNNLLPVFDNPDSQFKLQGYTFFVYKDYIQALKTGNLYYSAGEYRLWKIKIEDNIKQLNRRKALEQ